MRDIGCVTIIVVPHSNQGTMTFRVVRKRVKMGVLALTVFDVKTHAATFHWMKVR